MSARDDILEALRRSHRRGPLDRDAQAGIEERMGRHPRGPQLARVALDSAALVDLFAAKATAAAATVDRISTVTEIPAAIAAYLARENLPAQLIVAPDPQLDDVPWQNRPMLTLRRGAARATDLTSVTGAFAGIAETGTLMLTSGPQSPTTLNFLPETHIVVLRRGQIVGALEDAWDRLRGRLGHTMPRTVNFITGPSRSADIGQQLQMGAHGPRRLHIVLVEAGAAAGR